MKRAKESGASYRKKRKEREEELKKQENSIFKHFQRSSASASISSSEVLASPDIVDVINQEAEIPVNNSTSENYSEQNNSTNETFSTCTSPITNDIDNINDVEVEETRTEKTLKLDDAGYWPEVFTDEIRLEIVRNGSVAVQHINANFAEIGCERKGLSTKGVSRHLTRKWFFRTLSNGEKVPRSWLIYSPSKQALYCFCCKLFCSHDDKGKSSFATKEGYSKWWKLNPKLPEHESSLSHNRFFFQWKELELRLQSGTTIDNQELQMVQNKSKKWKEVLVRILDIIKFLAKQNLPLRGHRDNVHKLNNFDENQGNFLEMVTLLSKYDPVLREHVAKAETSKHQLSYLSPKIQNDFIEILGETVRSSVLNEVRMAKYFAIIFDSTPDISHQDQMSQVLRYVSITDKKIEVKEAFIDFIEIDGKDAQDVSNLILEKLEKDDIDIQNCRGQSYDNASVMSGKYSGVQARIKEINDKAEYINCTNHSLNLAGKNAASVSVNSVTFFETVEQVYVFFTSSTHRWDVLTATINQSVKRINEMECTV